MNLILRSTTALGLALGSLGAASPAWADMEAARAFLDEQIQRSTLTREEQEAEMQWFVDAAAPFAGLEIKVVSETIPVHEYEAQVLAPAFTAITGITVTHDLIGEGDVVERLQTQMQSGENIYDAYVNDSDLIGTHWRYQQARSLTDWMAGRGRLGHVADAEPRRLHRPPVHHRAGRRALPAPDQQFANLYWFR
jgi:glycerol transport system substrate-binding protein